MKIIGYFGLIAMAGAVLGCKSKEPAHSVAVETLQARVVKSERLESPAILQATGTLHARETATISAQVVGRVQQVLVREGDMIKPGQTLVVLDDATLRSASEQAAAATKAAESQRMAAQTNADLAATTLARYKQLELQKSVSPQEMDEVTRRAEAAAAQVDAIRAQANAMKAQESGAEAMLGYTRIRAPFSGIVIARMVDPGSLASPGVPLLQVDSAGPLQLQATVPESAIASVQVGLKVRISLDGAPDSDPLGTVSQVLPAADPSSHSFQVKIDLPASKQVRAGMYATAAIPNGTKLTTLVPRSAIAMRGSLACAYVLDRNNIAQLRYVTLGSPHGTSVEILSGIEANEALVDNPSDRDLAGKRIEVQP